MSRDVQRSACGKHPSVAFRELARDGLADCRARLAAVKARDEDLERLRSQEASPDE